jgi:hypothetical protein
MYGDSSTSSAAVAREPRPSRQSVPPPRAAPHRCAQEPGSEKMVPSPALRRLSILDSALRPRDSSTDGSPVLLRAGSELTVSPTAGDDSASGGRAWDMSEQELYMFGPHAQRSLPCALTALTAGY